VDSISLISYAKVNLGLRVIRKRPDGFHDIETILQTIDLHDQLEITAHGDPEIQVRCDYPGVPCGPENLIHQAAHLLQAELEKPRGCRIEVFKNIPPAAGLGGGSSNAATTLLGLNRLWGLNLSKKKLNMLAARLGSDVPFFLRGGTALARGRGCKLTSLRLVPEFWMVLVKPDFSISTSWAYGRVKISLTSNPLYVKLSSLKEISHLEQLIGYLDNDLEKAAGKHYPVVVQIKKELLSGGAMGAAMSGSGSAVFGLVQSHAAAERIAERIARAEWQVFVVRPIKEV
jgi:4-diphosphocytidyl-2-C-methyl-D-erythritol kinase